MVEILVVIVIIGILFSVLMPKLDFASKKARETGVKTDFKSFQTSAESYLRELSGANPNEVGLNTYLDGAAKINSGVSLLKDPWKNSYKMQIQSSTSQSLMVFRSPGPDGKSSSSTNLFYYTGTGTDSDDKILLVQYKNGSIASCTKGNGNDIGQMSISGAGTSLPAVTYDVPQSMRSSYESQYQYEYAITANIVNGRDNYWGSARTYVFSNTTLNLLLNTSDDGSYTTTSISEKNNLPYVGFQLWYPSSDMWGVYADIYNPPIYFSSGTIKYLQWDDSYATGGEITGIQDISGQSTSPYTILGCN